MIKPIRLGLIGCGGIVQLDHARAYRALTDTVKVVAIADVVEENLQKVGQIFDKGLLGYQGIFEYRLEM